MACARNEPRKSIAFLLPSMASIMAAWNASNSDLSIAIVTGGLGNLRFPISARTTAILRSHNSLLFSDPKSVEMRSAIAVLVSFERDFSNRPSHNSKNFACLEALHNRRSH